MTTQKKDLVTPHDKALRKGNADNEDSTTIGDPDLSPLGFHLQTGKEWEVVRTFIHEAMTHGDSYAQLRKNPKWSSGQHRVIVIDCEVESLFFGILVGGWEPGNNLTAEQLEDLCREVGQTGQTCEEVARKLRSYRGGKTVLTEGLNPREDAKGMQDELDSITKLVWPVVDALQIPANWRGGVPHHALLYVTDMFQRKTDGPGER